ncbi:CsbD family protein [Methylobacterium sp. B4]|uniref:CsbD family protein n=1 Tax=Methylobacterium sp. B4 TaxID=1938755 RepID=UPI000D755FE7|nr:CsbD family protein [Methylobacterium sp. B4]PXW53073.1 hypothetical protein BY998_12612 [Methylobacterium sp. B4]
MSERETGRENETSAERLKTSVKDAIGKLTGVSRNEAEGRRRDRAPPATAKPRGR